jgi:nicotinate-nucleotide pyrophosphorylase (carboxylating)
VTATTPTLAGVADEDVLDAVRRALREDLAHGPDITTRATIPADAHGVAELRARAAGVLAGLPIAATVFTESSEGRLRCEQHRADGTAVAAGEVLMTVTGPVRDLLTAERTALNFLTHLSGIATLTRGIVDAIAGTRATVRDSRKTLPGLRVLQKYAVRCGGGENHRMALGDQALIKDNHIQAAGTLTAAFRAVRDAAPELTVEVECDTLDQVEEAISAGATLILLDNMRTDQMRDAVRFARRAGGVLLEASGGLTAEAARAVAETGVDYLAIGALTHSAAALDIGLDLTG